ncbi:MAG: hypothetical protein ACRCZP_19950 [Phycicoccus sp.]
MPALYKDTVEFDAAVSFDAAVDFDSTVDLTGATTNIGARTVAANGALAIAGTDTAIILLNSSDAATKAATITAPTAVAAGGSYLTIVLKARSSTGSYTVAATNASTAGTVTFDAANESAEFVWINGTLHVLTLTGATFA